MNRAALLLAAVAAQAAGQSQGDEVCADRLGYVCKVVLYRPSTAAVGVPERFGAGFFLSADGIFLTARHLFVESKLATSATVEFVDGTDWLERPVRQVIASSRELDVLILQVELGAATVRVPPTAATVHVAEPVLGFRVGPPLPESLHGGIVCTGGRVSRVGVGQIEVRGEHFFAPGSSGSPLFNQAGEAIAVALEMVNRRPQPAQPDWTYAGLPIARARAVPKLRTPVPLADFLSSARRER